MKINFTFRHMDASDAVRFHTREKLARLERYEDKEMAIHAIFSVERFNKTVEFTVSGAHGPFIAKETREEMRDAIDAAADKLDKQMRREKSKRKHHKGHLGATTQEIG